MRLAYTSDLHGDLASYRALLELAVASGAKAAIVGGDLLPHAINTDRAIAVQTEFVERQLRPLLEGFHSDHSDITVYLLPGNDDWAAAVAQLDRLAADGLMQPLHNRVYRLEEELWLAGYACVPLTPFSIKDYERCDTELLPTGSFATAYSSWEGKIEPVTAHQMVALPTIADDLRTLARQSIPARTIYVCHTPPANTPLDQMRGNKHVGSLAVRRFIEAEAPPLTLHGHIHEAPHLTQQYATRLGSTWCINPGNDQRRLHAVTLDTDDIAGTLEHTVYRRPQEF